jgi:hypothetical protein
MLHAVLVDDHVLASEQQRTAGADHHVGADP